MAGEVFPIGTVLFFVGAWTDNVTMVGWYKCDGGSDPNIINHFVRGAAASGGAGGGSDAKVNISHTHSGIDTEPNHNHGGNTGIADPEDHTHSFLPWVWWDWSGASTYGYVYWIASSSDNLTLYEYDGLHYHFGVPEGAHYTYAGGHIHTTSSSGAAGAGKNMPEYKRAIPIIRRV